jgi:hypothetical protein
MLGGYLVGIVYMKITGRKRNPYNPFNIMQISPGGLLFGSIEKVYDVGGLTIRALSGDRTALYSLTSELPEMADDFIPFYNWTLRGLEAATDTKNLDRYALRSIIAAIDDEYKVRGGAYKMERSFVEKLQYTIAGPSVDVKEEENKPKTIGL